MFIICSRFEGKNRKPHTYSGGDGEIANKLFILDSPGTFPTLSMTNGSVDSQIAHPYFAKNKKN